MDENIPTDPAGFQYHGKDGLLVFEIGPRVIESNPLFAQKLGAISAGWAQAEASLMCFLAVLMDTTPDRTFALLNAYKTANSLIDGAKLLAMVTLESDQQASFTKVLGDLNSARERRNRFQHDLWGRLEVTPNLLYPVKAQDYTKYLIRLLAAAKETVATETREQAAARFARIGDEIVEQISAVKPVTVDDLEALRLEVNAIGWRIFQRIATHLGSSLRERNVPPDIVSAG